MRDPRKGATAMPFCSVAPVDDRNTATHTRAHSITHVHTATLTHGATRACFDGMLKKACSILDMFMPHSGWWRVTAVVVLVCRLLIHLGTPAGDSHGQRHAAGEADSRPFA